MKLSRIDQPFQLIIIDIIITIILHFIMFFYLIITVQRTLKQLKQLLDHLPL